MVLQRRKTFLTRPRCDSCKQRLWQGFRYHNSMFLLFTEPFNSMCMMDFEFQTRAICSPMPLSHNYISNRQNKINKNLESGSKATNKSHCLNVVF